MLINNKSLIKTINKLNLTDDEREKFNKISEDDKGNFIYNGKSIADISKENIIIDTYANIESIPSPYKGMIITVLEDETNSNKMTDYKVLSLKANALGIADSVVDQVQRYVDYLDVTNSGTGVGIDTSTFQLKTDESLETTDKTVVGAINELNNDLGGKSFIYLTQAEFDALESKNENVVYGITDYIETTSPSIDDIAAEISKLSLNINGSILSLIYNETTLSTVTLPTSSMEGTEVTETFGNIVLSKITNTLTRDGLVYYLDFKDQNYTADSASAYKTISDTNTLYSEELMILNINNTNNNYEGNVIDGNVLKSGKLSSKKYPRINNIDTLVTDIFTNGSFTFETYAQFNAKPVDNSTILFNTGTLLFRGNIGNDIGLYITTESNGSYGYFNFDSTSIDYTQPHLYTVTIDQSISGSITYSMYVDGELNQNGTKTGTIKTVATPYLHIIEDNDRNKEYASFRVYNKVLTADEVLANYQYEQTIERTW